MEIVACAAILLIVMSAFGLWIAIQKRRSPAEGCILGLLFGPLGVLVEALLPSQPGHSGNDATGARARSLDDRGRIAYIENRYRDVLEENDPDWMRLPYRRKRGIVKSVDKQLMRELRFTATQFADYSAQAKRNVLASH